MLGCKNDELNSMLGYDETRTKKEPTVSAADSKNTFMLNILSVINVFNNTKIPRTIGYEGKKGFSK